jgi:hypothetical protein
MGAPPVDATAAAEADDASYGEVQNGKCIAGSWPVCGDPLRDGVEIVGEDTDGRAVRL